MVQGGARWYSDVCDDTVTCVMLATMNMSRIRQHFGGGAGTHVSSALSGVPWPLTRGAWTSPRQIPRGICIRNQTKKAPIMGHMDGL